VDALDAVDAGFAIVVASFIASRRERGAGVVSSWLIAALVFFGLGRVVTNGIRMFDRDPVLGTMLGTFGVGAYVLLVRRFAARGDRAVGEAIGAYVAWMLLGAIALGVALVVVAATTRR
jgi:hypothetical protein